MKECSKNFVTNIHAVLFSSSVALGGPSPPFYRVVLHKKGNSWVSLGLPFIRRTKVGLYLGCENPTNEYMRVGNTSIDLNTNRREQKVFISSDRPSTVIHLLV